jgi:hypothetical protein
VNSVGLELSEFRDEGRWAWRLYDASGGFIAHHDVDLPDGDPLLGGFRSLTDYITRNADPARAYESEAELLTQLGGWIGERVFGEIAGRLAEQADSAPTTVKVQLPPEATALLSRPFELAHVADKPLAARDLSLTFEVAGTRKPVAKREIGDRLRMLAVFSVPVDQSALALRRERFRLRKVIEGLARMHKRAIELRVLQYGVTRERLRDVLDEGEGWDVIHFSGHGLPGGLLLENAAGESELIERDDLISLLSRSRAQLKLVTLSACDSAAATAAETLRVLGLEPREPEDDELAAEGEAGSALPGLAQDLVAALDCAALAMRIPVEDEFAITLSRDFYTALLGKGQPVARALQLALTKAVADPLVEHKLLSLVTPALFGNDAGELLITPPAGKPEGFSVATPGLAHFPDEPENFVGRVGALARASTVMAPESEKVGVLFCGMAGGGKTACALELTYRYANERFEAMAWYEAPKEGQAIDNALADLARALERQLPDFEMAQAAGSRADLETFLPRLTQLLEDRSIFVVIDNIESLLTESRTWKDDRWGMLIAAVTRARGLSRIVLTSRYAPESLDETAVETVPVTGLSLYEAVLLARQLPTLGKLMRENESFGAISGRELVVRTMGVVQGNPQLIKLADSQASDPEALLARLGEADVAWRQGSGRLATFVETGHSDYEPEDHLRVLKTWTEGVTRGLRPTAASLFYFLSVLEDGDRTETVVARNWPDVARGLKLESSGDPRDDLELLIGEGLVEIVHAGSTLLYRLHPAIAEAGAGLAPADVSSVTAAQLAKYWQAQFFEAKQGEAGGAQGGLLLEAGTRAAPYLIRLERWEAASVLLDQVIARDTSHATLGAVLPLLERIAAATAGTERETEDRGVLAKALTHTEPRIAEELLRELLPQAVSSERFELASGLAADLINLLRRDGRVDEALELAEQKAHYTEKAGLGPWTKLSDKGWRLQLLQAQGKDSQVLEEVEGLRPQLDGAAAGNGEEPEAVDPWGARESILDCARAAALALEQWQAALDWSDQVRRSKESRGAERLSRTRTEFNDYGPHIELRELDEAERLLDRAWRFFHQDRYMRGLGPLYSACAHLSHAQDHADKARELEERALREKYRSAGSESIALSHANLAFYAWSLDDAPTAAMHAVAAAVVRTHMHSPLLVRTAAAAAGYMAAGSFDEVRFEGLCERLGTAFGLDGLCTRLAPARNQDEVLVEALATIRGSQAPKAAARPELNQIPVWVRQGRTDKAIDRILAAT